MKNTNEVTNQKIKKGYTIGDIHNVIGDTGDITDIIGDVDSITDIFKGQEEVVCYNMDNNNDQNVKEMRQQFDRYRTNLTEEEENLEYALAMLLAQEGIIPSTNKKREYFTGSPEILAFIRTLDILEYLPELWIY